MSKLLDKLRLQQQFVQQLAGKVRNVAEMTENYHLFMLQFAVALFKFLAVSKGGDVDLDTNESGQVLNALLKDIGEFTVVEAERNHLLALLFEDLQAGITGEFHGDYFMVANENS